MFFIIIIITLKHERLLITILTSVAENSRSLCILLTIGRRQGLLLPFYRGRNWFLFAACQELVQLEA